MTGDGVEQSDKEAIRWFGQAVRQGLNEAVYPLGICNYNLEQYIEAYAWALVAESNGDMRLKELFVPMYAEEEIAAGRARFEELQTELKMTVKEQE